MRKLLFLLAALLVYNSSFGQELTYQTRLYYTAKIWGFAKYYHSEVSTCKVDWDSVALAVLPDVKNAASFDDFNDVMLRMLKAAGPMAIATGTFNDVLPPELKRNRDFSWLGDSPLRSDVRGLLDTIKINFRQHDICWVKENTNSSFNSYLVFPYEQLSISTNTAFPDEWQRLLILFKQWNIIRYFNPYNYVLDTPVDTILYTSVRDFSEAPDAEHLFESVLKLTSQLDDAHVDGTTYSSNFGFPYRGFNFPRLLLKYMEGHYVVVKSEVPDLYPGNAILSIDGLSITQWEDSLRPYISAGSLPVFRRLMETYLLGGEYNSTMSISYLDYDGNTQNTNAYRTGNPGDGWYPTFWYAADSLGEMYWNTFTCNTGYVNMGNLKTAQIPSMYSALADKPVIVFDIRNYPNQTGPSLAEYMYAGSKTAARILLPDLTYPGTFYVEPQVFGSNGNPKPYKGKIILLVNEQTQSQAEYTSMLLQAIPGTITVGSQTAGADGNITSFKLTNDLNTGFTSLGVYYPDNSPTQRVGIKIDIPVTPTRKGIAAGRDEVLDKALEIACKISGMAEQHHDIAMQLYPNPVNSILSLNAQWHHAATAEITVQDMLGRTFITQEANITNNSLKEKLDVKSLPSGTYIITIKGRDGMMNVKFIKD